MAFFCQFKNQFDSDIAGPDEFRFEPQWYSRGVEGGPLEAEIHVHGDPAMLWKLLQWLAWRVTIFNRHHNPVWWGYVEEAMVPHGNQMHGLSIRDMYNRVRVAYVYEVLGVPISGITDWAENAESIAALNLVKERERTTAVTATPAIADGERDMILAQVGWPIPVMQPGDGDPIAILNCVGFFRSFECQLYGRAAGMEGHTERDAQAEQVLGQGIMANNLCFAPGAGVSDLGGRFHEFRSGSKIFIAGSTGNNGTRKIARNDNRPQVIYTSDTISFDPSDDIHDFSKAGLSFIQAGDFISVLGSSGNSAVYLANSAAADHVTVRPASIGTEAAGPSITIQRGNKIELEEAVTMEFPDGGIRTITVHGAQVAQSFRIASDEEWTLDRLEIQLGKIGNPTGQLIADIRLDNNGQPGSNPVRSANVGLGTIGNASAPLTFQYNNTYLLQRNVTYWIVLYPSGGTEPLDFCVVDVDEQAGYPRGDLRLWTGDAWAAREPNASLLFRVLGARETTTQISEIVAASGQMVTQTDIVDRSLRSSNQYRDGSNTAYDEIVGLLNAGTSDGRRLIAEVTHGRALRIRAQQPRSVAETYQLAEDGRFYDQIGYPVEEGSLEMVGHWVKMAGIPPTVTGAARLSPRFLEEARYDCKSGDIDPRWEGDPSVWEAG